MHFDYGIFTFRWHLADGATRETWDSICNYNFLFIENGIKNSLWMIMENFLSYFIISLYNNKKSVGTL